MKLVRPREGTTTLRMNNKICKAPTYVVEVRELNAPKGSDTPHAVLHTKEPVASFDDCYHVVEHHGQRPMVEVSNSGLKIGLQFDGRKYETASRLTAVIGLIYAEVVCCGFVIWLIRVRRHPQRTWCRQNRSKSSGKSYVVRERSIWWESL